VKAAANGTRHYIRAALRHMAAGAIAAAHLQLAEAEKVAEREARRALAMDVACACGVEGPGHGSADDMAVAVERVA
jgi:hypothetical protein